MDIELSQLRPLSSESVEIRRGDGPAVEPRVVPVHVVGKEDDDVRARRFRGRSVARHNEYGQQKRRHACNNPLFHLFFNISLLKR